MPRLSATSIRWFPALVRITAATHLWSIFATARVASAARVRPLHAGPIATFVATSRVIAAVRRRWLQAALQVRRLPPRVHAAHVLRTPQVSRSAVPHVRAVRWPVAVRVVVAGTAAVHARVIVFGQAGVVVGGSWVIARKITAVHAWRQRGQVLATHVHARVRVATVPVVRATVGVRRAPAITTSRVGVATPAVVVRLEVASPVVVTAPVVVAAAQVLLAQVAPHVASPAVRVSASQVAPRVTPGIAPGVTSEVAPRVTSPRVSPHVPSPQVSPGVPSEVPPRVSAAKIRIAPTPIGTPQVGLSPTILVPWARRVRVVQAVQLDVHATAGWQTGQGGRR